MTATAILRAPTGKLDSYSFELFKHERGVTRVTWEPPIGASDAADVQRWLVAWRGHGRGTLMPLHELVPRASWHWYQASRPSALRQVRADVLARLCAVLNDRRSGLSIVELSHRG